MGAINYGRSDFVNLGIRPELWDGTPQDETDSEVQFLFEEVKSLIENEYFWEIKIEVVPGYYEGFWLNIEDPKFNYFEDWREKRDYLKELTRLRGFLLKCVQYGLVVYSPGWCMGYETKEASYDIVNKAIREAKQKARNTPTYRNYKGV